MKFMNLWSSSYKSKQGNLGLGKAISLFSEIGLTILLPLNDTQDYDLAVDLGGILKRISVKTTRFMSKSGKFKVLLKRCGGSSGKSKITLFNNNSSDFLFCYTKNNEAYVIPTRIITVKGSLTLTESLDLYKVLKDGKINLSALEEILDVEAP